jgi:hypothetical protein
VLFRITTVFFAGLEIASGGGKKWLRATQDADRRNMTVMDFQPPNWDFASASPCILRQAPHYRLPRAKARCQLWRGCFFGFGDAACAVAGALPPDDATGASPLIRSSLTSRRGQAKSSARPAGADKASPLSKTRAASASVVTGRDPGAPSN